LRLNCAGTLEDLSRQGIELREGLRLTAYADDVDENGQFDELIVDAVATYSKDEQCWVASIDWNAIRHSSEVQDRSLSGQQRRNELRPL
jgi:hypothetical protein